MGTQNPLINTDTLDIEAMKVVHPGLVREAGVAKHQPRPDRLDRP